VARCIPFQQAFWDQHGLQCGYCTPGMMLTSYVLLKHKPSRARPRSARSSSGNLCRCTGYNNIVKAVRQAADAHAASRPRRSSRRRRIMSIEATERLARRHR
jgi:aerobic carbon-monoxide dehydrogenase small subunit